MNIKLIYIDSIVYLDKALTAMAERKIQEKNLTIETIHNIPYKDSVLMDFMRSIHNRKGNYCIMASADTYPVISKILSTLTNDTLIATGDTLHPASASRVKKYSYKLHTDTGNYNIISVKSGEQIPEILFDSGERISVWQLFGSKDDLEELKKHAADNHFKFEFFEKIDGWWEIHTQSSYRMDKFVQYSEDMILFRSDNIFDSIIELLSSEGETISFAESCTGGLIASLLTSRSGSSDILDGSVVSYANRIKNKWLGVSEEILQDPGAVSKECVVEMAAGTIKLADSDMALAVSGIAGPTGGTPYKPVGTVYIAAAYRDKIVARHLLLKGDRNYIQYQSAMHAIKLLIWMKKKNFEEFFKNS